MPDIILLIIAAILFAIDAFRLASFARVNLTALGLLCWVLAGLV